MTKVDAAQQGRAAAASSMWMGTALPHAKCFKKPLHNLHPRATSRPAATPDILPFRGLSPHQ